ncbi:hypothetical protein GQ54DRAFT_301446 [Martensiomyces pterosporus]|nr:hypothetical protein GQ54DRAFT_301446 [Martensiomyces pterosporus]
MAPTEGIPEVVSAETKKEVEQLPALAAEAAAKVVSQVKHYFSDANLNHDNYMRKGIEDNDGWISFTTLGRFNRIRQLLGVPEDKPAGGRGRGARGGKGRPAPVSESYIKLLATTVKDGLAETDEVEIKEDGSAIKRKSPYEPSDSWFERTVHVKGLPYGKESADLIDELTAHFNKHGDVTLLRLRRNPKTKAFKGNVLVEFSTKEKAEEVAKKEDLEYEEHKLEPSLLSAYHDEKLAADEFIQPELRKPGATYPTFEEWCAAHGRKPPAPLKGEAAKKTTSDWEVVPGALVQFSGVEGDIGFAELKEAFGAAGGVKFVDFEKGSSEGIVRFREPIAAEVLEKNPEGIAVGEITLKLSAVDEQGEKEFYERAKAATANSGARGNKRSGNHDGRRNKRFKH